MTSRIEPTPRPNLYVAVIGPGEDATDEDLRNARQVGQGAARVGAAVLCGGLGGVMEAAAKGAFEAGGITLGLLPGDDRAPANRFLTVSLPTGVGEMRNALLVRAADLIIAVGGSWGTMSEISLACRTGKPVFLLGGWEMPADGPTRVLTAQAAVDIIKKHAERGSRG